MEINAEQYFNLSNEERQQVNNFVRTLCVEHIERLSRYMETQVAKKTILDGLYREKEKNELEEEYEVCEIINNTIQYIENAIN